MLKRSKSRFKVFVLFYYSEYKQNNFKLPKRFHKMAGEQTNYQNYMPDVNTKLRDLEEKQRVLKNQMLLIGKNLIETREKVTKDFLDIKKEIETLKENMERLTSFLDMASEEFPKFARKNDVEILAKQVRMFQPFSKKR